VHELSDTKIRNAKPADKEYSLADGQGLSVRVQTNGTKIWLYRERVAHQPAVLGIIDLDPPHQLANVVRVGQRRARIALGRLGQRFFQVASWVAGAVCGTDAELEDARGGRAQPTDRIISAAGLDAPQRFKQLGRLDLAQRARTASARPRRPCSTRRARSTAM
jgi:hypothetical protein